jgi:hypothetical protein
MFIPIPGNVNYTNIADLFQPFLSSRPAEGNIFHVLFTPTPESRAKQNDDTPLNVVNNQKSDFDAFEIVFGSPDNSIIRNIDVSTDDSKPTAESILNLQRLVDKDNSNKVVTTDCSTLSVMEGRSYKMKVEMLGNAQISPMQYFYVSKMPLFAGLYQVMNVSHSIKANDMSTSLEGVKMRFDGGNLRGVLPITLDSLRALSNSGNTIQPAVNSTSPIPPAPTNIWGVQMPTNIPVTSDDEIDLIPGSYLNNDKQPVTLIQIDGVPVEINTGKAYLAMRKAAKKDGVSLKVNSCFRAQFGNGIHTVSSKGKPVNASSQEQLRRKYLKPQFPNPDAVLNPKGKLVNVISDTLTPQSTYFEPLVSAPGDSTHGNGLAMDLNTGTRHPTPSVNAPLDEKVYTWLITNGWKYGFVRTVKTEEWHFDFKPDWAKLGPYGGFVMKPNAGANVSTIEGRDKAYFYTDLGLSNITVS